MSVIYLDDGSARRGGLRPRRRPGDVLRDGRSGPNGSLSLSLSLYISLSLSIYIYMHIHHITIIYIYIYIYIYIPAMSCEMGGRERMDFGRLPPCLLLTLPLSLFQTLSGSDNQWTPEFNKYPSHLKVCALTQAPTTWYLSSQASQSREPRSGVWPRARKARAAVSTLFATTASAEALNGTILGATCFPSPPCPLAAPLPPGPSIILY